MNSTFAKLSRLTRDPLAPGDGALLGAFLAGDQGAFAALVRRHAGLVFATCRRVLRHQQDAEDALQATFIVLARRAGDVWPREAVGSWLFGVAYRVALKARATRNRRHAREQSLEDVTSVGPPPFDADLAEVVQRVVCKLPDVYRAAVVACDLQGLSRKDAAAHLGWSEGTLSGRLARARGLLATRLRRLGLSLPVGGVATVLVATDGAPAAILQSTIKLATGAGAGVPVPVAALTEGVVRSMALFKLKTMAAVVFAACALGYGAFAASDSGGDEAGAKPVPVQKPGVPVAPVATAPPTKGQVRPGPRTGLAQQELEVLRQELAAGKGALDPAALKRLQARIDAITRLLDDGGKGEEQLAPDLAPLQGTWRVVGMTEANATMKIDPKDPSVVEISGGTLKLPYRVAGESGWKQREYKIAVDGSKQLKTINLVAPQNPVGYGVYEFTAPASSCVKCHENPVGGKGVNPPNEAWALCGPALKDTIAAPPGLRLALSINSNRPTKFGGSGVLVFEMVRAETDAERLKKIKNHMDELAKIVEADRTSDATLKRLSRAVELAQLESQQSKTELAMSTAQLLEARKAAELAEARWEKANAQWQMALREYEAAKAARDAKGKKVPAGAPGGGAPPGEMFTVHIRTLTAAEKVIRVKATGKESVLEGLVYAADDAPIMTGTVSVWVVRDKVVMPVDLPAITKNGEVKTNYLLKAGDQLFVQVKPSK